MPAPAGPRLHCRSSTPLWDDAAIIIEDADDDCNGAMAALAQYGVRASVVREMLVVVESGAPTGLIMTCR